MTPSVNDKYARKAKDNFELKLNLYLFDCYVNKNIEQIEFNIEEFHEFKISDELIKQYATEYYQKDTSELIQDKKINNIYNWIKNKKKLLESENKTSNFEKVFDKNDFAELLDQKECAYCGISLDQIFLLGDKGKLYNKRSDTRGYNLEIDRKNPNKEYTKDNCCMSCYWCNNAKTDEFNVKEFKEIARGINRIWNKRLKDIEEDQTICFPENSEVWDMP